MTRNYPDSAARIRDLQNPSPCTSTSGNIGRDEIGANFQSRESSLAFAHRFSEWLKRGGATYVDSDNNGVQESLSYGDEGVLAFHSMNAGRKTRIFFTISRIGWNSRITGSSIHTGFVIALDVKTRLAVAVLINKTSQHLFVCALPSDSRFRFKAEMADEKPHVWTPIEGSWWQLVDILPRGPVRFSITHQPPCGHDQEWTVSKPLDFAEVGVILLLANVEPFPMPPLPVAIDPVVQPQSVSEFCHRSSVRSLRYDFGIVRYCSATIVCLLLLFYSLKEYSPGHKSSELLMPVLDARTIGDGPVAPYSVYRLPTDDEIFSSIGDSPAKEAFRIELWRDSDGEDYVTAVLGDSCTAELRLDSDGRFLRLPRQLAEEAGATNCAGDPCISVTMEDGRVIECERMRLAKVDFGPTALLDVECAVLPCGVESRPCVGDLFFAKHCSVHSFKEDGVLRLEITPQTSARH